MVGRSESLIAAARSDGDVAHYLRSDDDVNDRWTRALCGTPAFAKWRRVGRAPAKVCQACLSCASAHGWQLGPEYENNPRRARQVDAQIRTGDLFTGQVPVLVAKAAKAK